MKKLIQVSKMIAPPISDRVGDEYKKRNDRFNRWVGQERKKPASQRFKDTRNY